MKNYLLSVQKKQLFQILLFVFVFVCVLFPNDFLHLKKITFVFIIGLNLDLYTRYDKDDALVLFYGILFPIALLLHGALLGVPFFTVLGRVYCCSTLLLLPVISTYDLNYKEMLLKAACVVMLITIGIFTADMLGIVNVNGSFPLKSFISNNQIGIMGKEASYAFQYKIFIKTSPLIVFLLFDQLSKRKYLIAAIAYFSLLISGTRANIAFCGACLLLYAVFFMKTENNLDVYIKAAIIVAGLVLIVLYGQKIYDTLYTIMVTNGRESDSVRIGHFQGLIVQYRNRPWTILTGTGMGSSYYSFGTGSLENSIELPYLDLLRQMGIAFFGIFVGFIITPLAQLRTNRSVQLAYFAYLLIAATNPLLFTSTAFLVYVYVYNELRRTEKNLE